MVELHRQGSTVPVSCHQVESSVLPIALEKAWGLFKSLQLEKVVPGKVSATSFTSGGPGQLDSVIEITYTDGAKWVLRINELSELNHSVGYQVLTTEPSHSVTSILGQILLKSVSDEGHTFVEWITDFSNDADATVVTDQKYKKLEFFAELKKNLSSQ
ncbi:UNKNOWN [Stylonychia lemnae]|uniref:Bet v I/Major latex protein domain-containing protein n=1 Tax=Stylonychia lemnae TaxID=5949 RepID=A0A078AZC6_STYLE|nr:UNKNOWN [Stylonychia lemnae]|eukprot:CDW86557.1 UNKNOWN [Stylonychia lemnae]